MNIAEAVNEANRDLPSNFLIPNLRPVEGGFENLTDIVVPHDVATILSFGIKFVPPHTPTFGDYIGRLYNIQNLGLGLHRDPTVYLRGYLAKSYDIMLRLLQEKPTSMDMKLSLMVQKTKQFLATHKDTCLTTKPKV